MAEIPLTPIVIGGEAEACLKVSFERDRRCLGMAPMRGVDAVDRRPAIRLESEERADAIHDLQDSNSPAGRTDGADTYEIPATTYFPRGFPPEYLRRWRA